MHFPADYRSARSAFIAAAEAADLGVTSRLNRHAKGPRGGALFLDTAWAGARDAKKALLLISGTHGVEGYFGSGVQTGLLRLGLAKQVPEGTKLVLLHALNPYGFAHDRRVNEGNVDVNRNFVDHAHPPANPEYDLLADAAAPRDIAPEAFAAANARLTAYAQSHGVFALQEALSRGQYSHPDGIYYGGARQCWSLDMVEDMLREELRGVSALTVIDFHTGLGESGAAECIIEAVPGSAPYARARAIWGDAVRSTASGGSLSAHLSGTVDAAFAHWLQGRDLTFVALEVGTVPLIATFEAVRKDNWLYAHGTPDDPRAADIKRQIRAAFYPETAEWQRQVYAHGEQAVLAALKSLAG